MIECLETSVFNSFHFWYFNKFPNLWFYLKERIIQLEILAKDMKNHKNPEETLNLSNDRLVWKKIEMELNRFYFILSYDHQNIKKLNDINFLFIYSVNRENGVYWNSIYSSKN
jgi:hypothetical protein